MSAQVIQLGAERARRRPGTEPWVNKKDLADHLKYSTRWIELRLRDGMPSSKWGGERRFKISQVEHWLEHTYRKDAS